MEFGLRLTVAEDASNVSVFVAAVGVHYYLNYNYLYHCTRTRFVHTPGEGHFVNDASENVCFEENFLQLHVCDTKNYIRPLITIDVCLGQWFSTGEWRLIFDN